MKDEKNRKNLILLTAGGTGGHIYPAEALAQALIAKGFDVEFVTDSRGKGNYKGTLGEIKNYAVLSGALVGKSKLFKIKSLIKTALGVLQACFLILRKRPICVVGFGGYASFPCCVAAVLLGVKLVVHEQNSVMSRTNRLLGKYAELIAKSFENVKYLPENKKIIYSGMPVREQIVKLYAENRKIPEDSFQILIMGGSQGAKVFADVVPEAIEKFAKNSKKKITVVQQCREDDEKTISEKYKEFGMEADVNHFFGNMPELYRNSQIIISRAGASSVCEIMIAGIPSILVPLPIAADNHQYFNALNLVENNAGILIEQKDFEANKLSELLLDLSENPSKLEFFSQNAKNHAVPNAAEKLAEAIEKNIVKRG